MISSAEMIIELERLCGEEVGGLLSEGLNGDTMHDPDHVAAITAMAMRLGVPPDELNVFVLMRWHIRAVLGACYNTATVDAVRQLVLKQIGIRQDQVIGNRTALVQS